MSYSLVFCSHKWRLLEEIDTVSAEAAASFQNKDVLVEPTWKCLRRLAVVTAQTSFIHINVITTFVCSYSRTRQFGDRLM